MAETDFDSEVTMTFDTNLRTVAQEFFDDFLKASGFEVPFETESVGNVGFRVTRGDFLAKEEDWMWDDALASKFRNDGPVGSGGADVINFPISDS